MSKEITTKAGFAKALDRIQTLDALIENLRSKAAELKSERVEGVDGFWNWRRYCRLGDAHVIANICRKFGWRAWTAIPKATSRRIADGQLQSNRRRTHAKSSR